MVSSVEFVSPDTATFNVGQDSQFLIGVSGSPRPALALSGPLPAGLEFKDQGTGTGLLSGVPLAPGRYELTAIAVQEDATSSQKLVIQVCGPPSIVAASPIVVRQNKQINTQILTNGFPIPTLELLSDLPGDLVFTKDASAGTARLDGTPSEGGSWEVTFGATNPYGSAELAVQLVIEEAPQITSDAQIAVMYGSPMTRAIKASGHPAPIISVIGSLPEGLSLTDHLDGTAELTGKLSSPGEQAIEIVARNTAGKATQQLRITANKPPVIISPDVFYYAGTGTTEFSVEADGWPVPELKLDGGQLPSWIKFTLEKGRKASIIVNAGDGKDLSEPVKVTITASSGSGESSQTLTLHKEASPKLLNVEEVKFSQVREGCLIRTQGAPPPILTLTAPQGITLTSTGDGQAMLKAPDLPAGKYNVIIKAENKLGRVAANVRLQASLAERLLPKLQAARRTVAAWRGGWTMLAVLIIIATFLVLAVLIGKRVPHGVTVTSYIIAAGLLIAAGVLVSFACRTATPPGIRYLFTGTDLRTSTSKTQYLMWTAGVAFALAYVSARSWLASTQWQCPTKVMRNCIPGGSTWDQYIILLGVPAAAAVVAKGVTSYKVANGTLQKVPADQASGVISLSDLTGNDNGQADLVDIQYLVFNLIAFVYVAVYFVRMGTLVSVPSMLLGLTSTAAAAYTLNKTLQNSQPRITGVIPRTIAPEVDLTITGVNLFPAGSPDTVTVGIAGSFTTGERGPGDSVRVTAPTSLSPTDHTVVVTTAANITCDPFPIDVQGAPLILGWKTSPLPGGTSTLIVSGLPSKPSQHQFFVKVADTNPAKADVSGTDVSFTLDANASGTVAITLIVDGIANQPVELVIPKPR